MCMHGKLVNINYKKSKSVSKIIFNKNKQALFHKTKHIWRKRETNQYIDLQHVATLMHLQIYINNLKPIWLATWNQFEMKSNWIQFDFATSFKKGMYTI